MTPEAHLRECDRARERGDLDAAIGHVKVAALGAGLITGDELAAMIEDGKRIAALSPGELAEELRTLARDERLPEEVRARMARAADEMTNERIETWRK